MTNGNVQIRSETAKHHSRRIVVKPTAVILRWILIRDTAPLKSRCRMFGVPLVRECSGTFRGSSAHAGISEMEHSAVRPCRENENILKMEVN